VQIFIIYTGPSYGDTTNLQATAAANGGSFLTPTTTIELVDALFKIIALPSNSLPTVTSTVTLTAISEDSKAITLTAAQLLVGATDADKDALSVQNMSVSSGRLVQNAGNGSWNYTPDANFNGGVTFTFDITDGKSSITQQALLTIKAVNDAAIVGGVNTGSIVEDATLTTVSGQLTVKDIDSVEKFQAINTASNSKNGYGAYTVTEAGKWTFTLNNTNTIVNNLKTGESLTDSFTILTADGTAKIVTVSIKGTTDAPTATIIYGTQENDQGECHALYGTDTKDIIYGLRGDDDVFGYGGDDDIFGGAGNDTLCGGNGNDRLIGGAGKDILTGDSGNDTFFFRSGIGNDVITDFKSGVGLGDVLEFSVGSLFDSFAEIMSITKQVGSDTVISFNRYNVIHLEGVQKSSLVADDFKFSDGASYLDGIVFSA
jgi:VCBS repeat-containing protein